VIVVFGSINADLFFTVDNLPTRGETVLCPGYSFRPGGKGANQAVAAARAGAKVAMVGKVGDDAFALAVRAALAENRVDIERVVGTDGVTGTAAVLVEASGENQIVVASAANMDVRHDQVPDALLGPATTLVLQMEVPVVETDALIERAADAGARVILNLAPYRPLPSRTLGLVDVLIVNEGEAAALAGGDEDASDHARRFAEAYGCTAIVTLGGSGAVMADRDGMWRIAALDVDPVDTVGAGDAFVGILAAALDAGEVMPEALRRASVGAGLACLHEGAQSGLPTAAEIDSVLPRLAPAIHIG
jgi:ribokinase